MASEYEIRQSESYEGEDWWSWSVWVEADDHALDLVDHVEWTLHPTFPTPIRRVEKRATKFRLDTGGWGVFTIHACVSLKGGSEVKLKHMLQLHYPDGKEAPA
jgi:transcription initiation factor IIF auxiliary subunit